MSGLILVVAALALVSSSNVLGAPAQQSGSVNFTLVPVDPTVDVGDIDVGEIVEVAIQFDASVDPVSAAQAYLNFDSSVLQVVDANGDPVAAVTPGSVFDDPWTWQDELQNEVDNSAGEINFAGGKGPGATGGSDAAGVSELATFRFQALASTAVGFNDKHPRQTIAVSNLADATGELTGMAITVGNTPPVARDDSGDGFTTDEHTSFTTNNVLGNDVDPDGPGPLSVVSFDDSSSTGLVTNTRDGTFFYDPNGQFESLNGGEEATDSFTYTVSDGDGGTDTATVTITITGVSNAPVDVAFNLSLQGRNSSATGLFWTMRFEVEFYEAGTTNPVDSATASTTSSDTNDSSFMVNNIMPGTYDIWVKGENTLSQLLPGVGISEADAVVDLGEQLGGDATGGADGAPDNVVDIADYSALLDLFGTETSELSPAQQLNDHNRDGTIDVIDYPIIVKNFGPPGVDSKPGAG